VVLALLDEGLAEPPALVDGELLVEPDAGAPDAGEPDGLELALYDGVLVLPPNVPLAPGVLLKLP